MTGPAFARLKVALVGVVLATAPGCGPRTPIPDQEILLRIVPGVQEVESGKAFSLTVVRVWAKSLVPEAWTDAALAPLVLHLVDTARREDDRHIEETRHYRCHVFAREAVPVPAIAFKATPAGGGPERVAAAPGWTLRVKPALDAAAPGPPELPGDLLEERVAWWRWSLAGAAVIGVLGLLARSRRPRVLAPVPAPVVPALSAIARALARLDRLRGREPVASEEVDAYYVEVSALVRDYLEEQLGLRAPEMTTEEFLAAPETTRALEPAQRTLLAGFLARCDRVKFGGHVPVANERTLVLDEAAKVILETGDRANAAS